MISSELIEALAKDLNQFLQREREKDSIVFVRVSRVDMSPLPHGFKACQSPLPEDGDMPEPLPRGEPQMGQSLAKRLKGNMGFLVCQKRSGTEVNAVSEREMAIG